MRTKTWVGIGVLAILVGTTWIACDLMPVGRVSPLDTPSRGGSLARQAREQVPVFTISPEWHAPVKLGPPVNSVAWEDAASISADGKTLFFSRGRHDAGKREAVNVLYSRKIEGKWTEPALCEFNMKSVPTSAPKPARRSALDASEQTVYFASIRPGGHGHGDIYFATRLPDGGWSRGENVGPPINTKYNESEPHVFADGTKLYFTSNRPGGVGAMDNWMSTKVNGTWTEPVNLGQPANSRYDDLQPFVTKGEKSLYFTRMNFANVGKKIDGYHAAILRCDRDGGGWSEPQVVLTDWVGQPSLTADERQLYFVHAVIAGGRPVDADIWMAERK